MTDSGTLAVKQVHKRFERSRMPKLKAAKGSVYFVEKQLINTIYINLFEISFRISEHKRLLDIDKYNMVNDYCLSVYK